MNITIRPEQQRDISAIRRVTEAAFASAAHASGTEPQIVEALRNARALSISLVAECNGEVIGHVAVSPVHISDGSKGWFGFGPVSVLPEYQRQGVGTSLMRSALDALKHEGAKGCVLVGDPGYYGRFGFRPVPDLTLPDVPTEYFQALRFGSAFPAGSVTFHEAFAVESK
ncbi:putative acetyltransferase [Marinobacter pelagius]|uniref:Putative acetyltransferase n=1 Tax=Marinobacter pelagius TaxID=379482 RepID=A0A366GM83_9GAMM|nr:N-acetyltransferase [Marinobacter pelagius]RBP28501.1 putative acetyltransferase [Marinobacter pelagius]